MIIPDTERTLLNIFYCPKCGSVYRAGARELGCAVYHSPGSCCHYGDAMVGKEEWEKIAKVLKLENPYIENHKHAE